MPQSSNFVTCKTEVDMIQMHITKILKHQSKRQRVVSVGKFQRNEPSGWSLQDHPSSKHENYFFYCTEFNSGMQIQKHKVIGYPRIYKYTYFWTVRTLKHRIRPNSISRDIIQSMIITESTLDCFDFFDWRVVKARTSRNRGQRLHASSSNLLLVAFE